MTVRFACPHCRRRLTAPEAARGRKARCLGCGQPVEVPTFYDGATDTESQPKFESPQPLTQTVADDEIDMTPMIDVVFQLLIFFMVTSTFAMQKALPMPNAEAVESAAQQPVLDERQEDDDLVVRIDADDSVWVDDVLAVSRQDLIAKLRAARTTPGPRGEPGPKNLRVSADPDAHHGSVVMALDAGSAAGMEEVRLESVEEND